MASNPEASRWLTDNIYKFIHLYISYSPCIVFADIYIYIFIFKTSLKSFEY